MADFTDWLARTFFVSEDQTATAKNVADAQQRILDKQYADGQRDTIDYLGLSSEIQSQSGSKAFDSSLGSSGLGGLVKDIVGGGSSKNDAGGFNLFGSVRWLLIFAVIGAVLWFGWPSILRQLGKLKR